MRIIEQIIIIVAIVAVIVFVILTLGASGTITIEKPYHDEYKATQGELSDCQEALEQKVEAIKCPAVECKPGYTGMVLAVVGMFWGMFGMGMYLLGSHKSHKQIKESKEKKQ